MTHILGHHHISMRTKSGDANTHFYRDITGTMPAVQVLI